MLPVLDTKLGLFGCCLSAEANNVPFCTSAELNLFQLYALTCNLSSSSFFALSLPSNDSPPTTHPFLLSAHPTHPCLIQPPLLHPKCPQPPLAPQVKAPGRISIRQTLVLFTPSCAASIPTLEKKSEREREPIKCVFVCVCVGEWMCTHV